MEDLNVDFGALMRALEANGAPDVVLPAEVVRVSLTGSRQDGLPFEDAWSSAINRIQPSELFEDLAPEQLAEDRSLIEEDRAMFRAAYENREPTVRERAERVRASWSRLDLPRSAGRGKGRRGVLKPG